MRKIIVEKDYKKISTYLQNKFNRLPKGAIFKALRNKDIRVNDVKTSEDISIKAGDELTVYITDDLLFGNVSLSRNQVAYEDENIIVVSKPQNMIVVSEENDIGLDKLVSKMIGIEVYPCHRLDRNTAGLVIFAKSHENEQILFNMIKNHDIKKLYKCTVYGKPKNKKATLKAIELVSSGTADMVMKGLVDTATFLRSVLNKEVGLRTGKLMSHVSVFEVEGIDRLILLTDAAFNTYPDLKQKVQIINNSVMVAKACGIENPKVAPVCAVEVVNPDMPATIDAALLSKMSDRGQIKGCIVDGPLALDNALSEEAAHHKGVTGPVAGKADILVLPNIDVANVMYKSLTYTAQTKNGGILVGTSAPVILTSRADSFETKVNSIALAALVSEGRK